MSDPGSGAAAPVARRATVVGMGLIGGSIGQALRQHGWHVSGVDRDPERVEAALRLHAVDAAGPDPEAELVFVAVPVRAIPTAAEQALADAPHAVVTDVGSVKASVVDAVHDPRFVGGHPMAGSEQVGVEGSDPNMFNGAIWVLTPNDDTLGAAFSTVAAVVRELGAEVVALPPERHDELVAVVSHVPHLTAATLMAMAEERAEDHAALLRLAAGGFRDMTRIASGHPAIWRDICAENRSAIVDALDGLIGGLTHMRSLVADADGDALTSLLDRARRARNNLPTRAVRPEELAEMRVPIPDRPGAAAEVFTLAAELGVNIDSFEVVHSAEGNAGIAILLVDAARAELFRGGLMARRFKPSVRALT